MKRRVTIRHIAEEVGYHFTTVSLALRRHPSIPAVTREKIEAAAARLGYRPDPMLGALMSYRTDLRRRSCLSTLAWLTNYPTRDGWRAATPFEEFFEGASVEADRLGHRIEVVWMREAGMSPRRLGDVLRARGIQGLLLAPQPIANSTLDFDWGSFASVTFGYTLHEPALHGVSNHHFRSMLVLLEHLQGRGYRRCGYVEERRVDARVSHGWLGAYRVFHDVIGEPDGIPPLRFDAWSEAGFGEWFERHRPDVIVTKYKPLRAWLEARGVDVPGDVALASPSLTSSETEWAGMRENARAIGRAAVQLLAGLLRHQEFGVPELPQRILIEGTWTEGSTVRPPQGAATAPGSTR